MKWIATLIWMLFAMVASAQPEFTEITLHPSPLLTNYNRITLTITNLTPNQAYALPITRRLTLGWEPYVTFCSPSNSIEILRDTSNSIPIRFYRVAPTNFFGLASLGGNYFVSGYSEWDDHDIPCAACDEEDASWGSNTNGIPLEFPPVPGYFTSQMLYFTDGTTREIVFPPLPPLPEFFLRNRTNNLIRPE